MNNAITKIVLEETTINDILPKLKTVGEQVQIIKKYYPRAWSAISSQYNLENSCYPKTISDELFDKKLEVLLMEDEELRNK